MLFAEKKNNEIKRKNRIQQVREQSKHFASTIRRRVQAQQGRPPAPAPALASKAPSAPAPRQYFSQLPAVGINDLISPRQAKRIRDQGKTVTD